MPVIVAKKDFKIYLFYFKNLDIFKFYWDELWNFVYYLISKYLAINSLCGDRIRSTNRKIHDMLNCLHTEVRFDRKA